MEIQRVRLGFKTDKQTEKALDMKEDQSFSWSTQVLVSVSLSLKCSFTYVYVHLRKEIYHPHGLQIHISPSLQPCTRLPN